MATILLSAAGAAVGSALGGSVLGLSSVVIGRAVGATLGQVMDQQILGSGSAPVETARVDRFRLTGAGEGGAVNRLYGRIRVSGQVIWASRFQESSETTGGGKTSGPAVTRYSYSVSLAVALCEGEIARLGRIWADGTEIARDDLNLRVYTGSADQQPDPKIEAVEGAGRVPAYRGLAYVVIEDLPLARFGNRVPQFSFEVVRPTPGDSPANVALSRILRGAALIPGTGEYALATTPVHYGAGLGMASSANVNTPSGKTDFAVSLEMLNEELPECASTLLVASWFGDDLRCGLCRIRPKPEQAEQDGSPMPWQVSGIARSNAQPVAHQDGRPVYGGTPADAAVAEAIAALNASGKAVTFYPFILMEQLSGNTLTDPWTGQEGQPALPWRGRITTALASQVEGTTDSTAAAETEVAAFFGQAMPGDFTPNASGTVTYDGPEEWSYRRFILHYAHLCANAGGVDAFCIGSEMRGLTRIRGAGGSFPAVDALRALAADLRGILGPDVKIGYAADWSEYFGYHPRDGSGDVYFNLDPLWADDQIDFIGIDNYMPMSDWRDGTDHADAHWGTIYDLDYLKANIEGGEGYDWFYPSPEAAEAQRRAPITDVAYDEHWVFRYKDIRNWWLNDHHERIGGVRQAIPTAWVPQSKPVWFTEYGCAAIDKGTNAPNRFLDPKSSESALPPHSTGRRDDFLQQQYLRAMNAYWSNPAINPTSTEYGGPMIEMGRANVWAWDTRPFPWFPANTDLWRDGENHAHGHWLNGRASAQALGAVVEEICAASGVPGADVARLYGVVRGYVIDAVGDARAALQPLMLGHAFDAVERDGGLEFRSRGAPEAGEVLPEALAVTEDRGGPETIRAPEAEIAGRVRLTFVESEADYETRVAEAIFPDRASHGLSATELPLVLTGAEGRSIAERWLAEARVARDRARFALPMSRMRLGAGDVVKLSTEGGTALYRLDRVEQGAARQVEAARVEPEVYVPSDQAVGQISLTPFAPPLPVFPLFMDLPLLTGDEIPHAPHLAVTASPWPGSVAVFSAAQDEGYELNRTLSARALVGVTETPLFRARPGLWDRGPALRVKCQGGTLASTTPEAVLNGANVLAIGDGSGALWEIFQFVDARIVAENTYELSLRLRGQAGSDGLMPDVWPAGSYVVALDGAPEQIAMPLGDRGLARHYRIGPAGRPWDDPSYRHVVAAYEGAGLRPYAPCHLSAVPDGAGGLRVEWVRRTRIDGDSWEGFEVPLGEASLLFVVRVRDGQGRVLREAYVETTRWSYSAADQSADGVLAPFVVEVAQVSESYGPGPFERIGIGG